MEPTTFWYAMFGLVLLGLVIALCIIVTRKGVLEASIESWSSDTDDSGQ
jgi:hypothetical protein